MNPICRGSCASSSSTSSSDEDDEGSSTNSCSESRQGSGGGGCCCCCYDPFEDDSPEQRIRDLPFALRKLSVMKCQMRKWRVERLQIESEARSLKLALQSLGVNADAAVKPDPLIAHLRAENLRLKNRGDEMQDTIRDLRETIAERSASEGNPCGELLYAREKILAVRQRSALEKRQLRETISNLQLKLEEAREDGSCAALNRLRAKLRELMKDEKRGDQQVSSAVEKSVEALVDLSKSCDELRRQNESLLAEIENLKKEIKAETEAKSLDYESEEIAELLKRVKACEAMVAQLRMQLAEKDDAINELQTSLFNQRRVSTQLSIDLDQMTVSQKALTREIEAMKAELQGKDGQITKLLRDLRQSTVLALGMGELESELERMRPEMYELASRREELVAELSGTRRELSERNEQIIRLLEESGKQKSETEDQLRQCGVEAEEMREREARATAENERLAGRLAELEERLKDLSELDDLKSQLESLKAENAKLFEQLKEANQNLEILTSENQILKKDKDNLTNTLTKAQEKLDEELKNLESMKSEMDEMRKDAKQNMDEASDALKEKERLSNALKNMENDLASLKQELEDASSRCSSEIEALRRANSQLKGAGDDCARELDELRRGAGSLSEENARLRAELAELNAERLRLSESLDALAEDLEREKASLSASAIADKDRLERELGDLKWQLEKLKKDLEAEQRAKVELQNKLEQAAGELNRLSKAESAHPRARSEKSPVPGEARKSTGSAGREPVPAAGDQRSAAKERPASAHKKPDSSAMQAGDFLRAGKALEAEMQRQIEALNCVRNFVYFVDGQIKTKPMMTANLKASGDKDWNSSEIKQLFHKSWQLSETILKIHDLIDGLKEGDEDENESNGSFDAKAWLQSLTLTELAELHDQVCELTFAMIEDDCGAGGGAGRETDCSGCGRPQQASACRCRAKEAHQQEDGNARIAALQRRIAEKQRVAAERAAEMRRCLMREQAELIRLSDEMNRQRELNLALRLSVDETMPFDCEHGEPRGCCAREDCPRAGRGSDCEPTGTTGCWK